MERTAEFRIPKKLCRRRLTRRPHEIVLALMESLTTRLQLFRFEDHEEIPKNVIEQLMQELQVSLGVINAGITYATVPSGIQNTFDDLFK